LFHFGHPFHTPRTVKSRSGGGSTVHRFNVSLSWHGFTGCNFNADFLGDVIQRFIRFLLFVKGLAEEAGGGIVS
jgi:hypothetical protein